MHRRSGGMADALGLEPSGSNPMEVRLLSSAREKDYCR